MVDYHKTEYYNLSPNLRISLNLLVVIYVKLFIKNVTTYQANLVYEFEEGLSAVIYVKLITL